MLALVTSALVLASSALAGQASRLNASPLRATRGFCMSVDAAATKTPSFVQTEMRGAAMKLHTRDQAPKEGQQPAQKPVSTWQPGRAEYLQFLVDSKAVYSCLDAIVASTPALATLSNSGLERTEALDKDVRTRLPRPPPHSSCGCAHVHPHTWRGLVASCLGAHSISLSHAPVAHRSPGLLRRVSRRRRWRRRG